MIFFGSRVDFRKSGCAEEGYHVATRLLRFVHVFAERYLSAEAVEGLPLPLEGVDDVHGSDGLAAGVLGVGDRVADDVLEEDLEHAAGLLVDEARDTLHATTASETADGGLGDALDIIAKDLAVALGAALAQSLASFSTSRHDVLDVL